MHCHGVYTSVCVCIYVSVCVEVGQFTRVSSFFPPSGFWRLNLPSSGLAAGFFTHESPSWVPPLKGLGKASLP